MEWILISLLIILQGGIVWYFKIYKAAASWFMAVLLMSPFDISSPLKPLLTLPLAFLIWWMWKKIIEKRINKKKGERK